MSEQTPKPKEWWIFRWPQTAGWQDPETPSTFVAFIVYCWDNSPGTASLVGLFGDEMHSVQVSFDACIRPATAEESAPLRKAMGWPEVDAAEVERLRAEVVSLQTQLRLARPLVDPARTHLAEN